jgi:hypothetical protein
LVSSICWYAIINNLTVQGFEVVLAFIGPVSEIFCHIEAGLSGFEKHNQYTFCILIGCVSNGVGKFCT